MVTTPCLRASESMREIVGREYPMRSAMEA